MCHYITNYNRKRLFYLIPFKVLLDCKFEGDIYKGCTPVWLNKLEVAKLLAYQEYCKNPNQFLTRYKKFIDLNNNHIFSRYDVSPAYHTNPQCENLLSSYSYFVVPDEIKEKGADVIKQYKEFVRENFYLIECERVDILEFRINVKFNVVTKLMQGNRPNSGVTDISFEFAEIEKEIDDTLNQLNEWRKDDIDRNTIVSRLGGQTFKIDNPKFDKKPFEMYGCSDDYVREVLRQFNNNFKQPLIELFNSYYEASCGEEKSAIESNILDQLGFHPCSKCVSM